MTTRSQFQQVCLDNKLELQAAWLPLLDVMAKYNIGSVTLKRNEWGLDVEFNEYLGGISCPTAKDLGLVKADAA